MLFCVRPCRLAAAAQRSETATKGRDLFERGGTRPLYRRARDNPWVALAPPFRRDEVEVGGGRGLDLTLTVDLSFYFGISFPTSAALFIAVAASGSVAPGVDAVTAAPLVGPGLYPK
jgi:hypothetical protein